MRRPFQRFVGIDLGGARGKTTAVAELSLRGDAPYVDTVATRHGDEPWRDDTLWDYLTSLRPGTAIAISAPLTAPACGRCVRPVCPGAEACEDPAVIWLRNEGAALIETRMARSAAGATSVVVSPPRSRLQLAPYSHRAADVHHCYERGVVPASALGAATGLVAARARQLVRRLAGAGLRLHQEVIEVSAPATISALLGTRRGRAYKRDADPWQTRATILDELGHLAFAPSSRMSREDALRSDHCFDALIAGYTGYLWARDGWTVPPGPFDLDGWTFVPPSRR